MSNVLPLTLKREYFNQILCGTKKEEYREVKPYWVKRLCGIGSTVFEDFHDVVEFIPFPYFFIEFKNGYGYDVPTMLIKCENIELKRGIETPLGKGDFFVLKLGDIEWTRNLKNSNEKSHE